MNRELRDKMIVFNRKARAAKLDGYAVIAGKVMEPKPGTPWEMREVCAVDDYTSRDEALAVRMVAKCIENFVNWEPGSKWAATREDAASAVKGFQQDLVNNWGWTWEQVERHEAVCMDMMGASR